MSGFVDRARERGIEFATGGQPVELSECPGGYFYAPSVAIDVPPDDELAQQEVFGPVLSVIECSDIEEAVAIADNTRYGLAAGIHTRDISTALRFSRAMSAGQVYVNGYHGGGDTVPFGGMRDSGIGREKGLDALRNYCQSRATTVTLL